MEKFELNPNVEYILAGDISGSMAQRDPLCGDNVRYNYMLEQFESFIRIAADYDEHGAPTVMLFGTDVQVFEHVTLNDIKTKLASVIPDGFTNLHLLIDTAYQQHKTEKRERAAKKEVHPGTALLVFTDGEPTNKPAVERALIRIVSEIDRADEFQIHFLTVGTIEPSLQRWLSGLHDNMENPKINPNDYDIIHVSKLEEVTFLGLLEIADHKEVA